MSEKMLVTQALDERDLLVKKIGDKIAKANFVDTIRPNEDKVYARRVEKAEFTKEAKAAYQPLRQICEDWNRRITGGLTEEERAQFMRLLEKVGEAAVEQNRLELEELNSAKEE